MTTEQTDQGEQHVLEGAQRLTDRQLAELSAKRSLVRGMTGRAKAKKP